MQSVFATLFLLLLCGSLSAQTAFHKCGADDLIEQGLQDPVRAERMAVAEQHTQTWIHQQANPATRDEQAVITIPVVVHVIEYDNNPESNISDAQIFSQIDALNRIFRRTDDNTDETRAIFVTWPPMPKLSLAWPNKTPTGCPPPALRAR